MSIKSTLINNFSSSDTILDRFQDLYLIIVFIASDDIFQLYLLFIIE